jgi:four helix bundle protein
MSKFDLEERCIKFSNLVCDYVNRLPKLVSHEEYGRQLIRSAGSIGANYLEANEGLSKKDFMYRLRVSKKEARETRYWLRLTKPSEQYADIRDQLVQESSELIYILASIIKRVSD